MDTIKMKINGKEVEVEKGTLILDAATKIGVNIPTLCYHPDQEIKANCRICTVEIEGARTLQPACATVVQEGMEVRTNTPVVREARKMNIELMLANHNMSCTTCIRNGNCELQGIASELGIRETRFENIMAVEEKDESSPAVVRNQTKCIKCGRCIQVCDSVQGLRILDYMDRGNQSKVMPAYGRYLNDVACVSCGQCSVVCPVAPA